MSALGHRSKFPVGAHLFGTTSDGRHRLQPRGFFSRATSSREHIHTRSRAASPLRKVRERPEKRAAIQRPAIRLPLQSAHRLHRLVWILASFPVAETRLGRYRGQSQKILLPSTERPKTRSLMRRYTSSMISEANDGVLDLRCTSIVQTNRAVGK